MSQLTEAANGTTVQPGEQAFEVGDTVHFNRSNNVPMMTIVAVGDQSALCFWFSKSWVPCFAEFPFQFISKVMRQ